MGTEIIKHCQNICITNYEKVLILFKDKNLDINKNRVEKFKDILNIHL